MEILIFGGTGAIGVSLVELLSRESEYKVLVTSRSQRKDYNNIKYILGNAKEKAFFNQLMKKDYDVIIDLMSYSTSEFKERLQDLLAHTNQYVFFSSARCYADTNSTIKENSNRLVDVIDDKEYLATDEYGLAKGREENLLFSSGMKNYTIIRPYITYNSNRLQLGVFEKENWLKRALDGKTIVFPQDIANMRTSLTYANDVAGALIGLLNNKKAFGEAFHITTDESYTWGEILEYYVYLIEIYAGKKVHVKMSTDSLELQSVWNQWQIKYDRLYNRVFDNSKIMSICGKYDFKPMHEGIKDCLFRFLEKPQWGQLNAKYEGWCDKKTNEISSLREFRGLKNKLSYIYNRI